MSSRDIDSTSENVLHDWAADHRDESQEELAIRRARKQRSCPRSRRTTASRLGARRRRADPVANASVETEGQGDTEELDAAEDVPVGRDRQARRQYVRALLARAHASHIPDGYAVLGVDDRKLISCDDRQSLNLLQKFNFDGFRLNLCKGNGKVKCNFILF